MVGDSSEEKGAKQIIDLDIRKFDLGLHVSCMHSCFIIAIIRDV